MKRLFSAIFIAAPLLLVSAPADASRLEFWRFDANQNQLEFTTDDGVQPNAQLVSDPTRLVIDLPGILLDRPVVTQVLNGQVRSLRIGQFERNTTRLVIELAPGYTLEPGQIKFRGIAANRWVVKLPTPQLLPGAAPVPLAGTTAIAASPPAVLVVSAQSSGTGVLSPILSSSMSSGRLGQIVPRLAPVPTYANQIQPPQAGRLIVVIDPGHGGPDPGAIGIGGLQEKDIVLDIGTKVAGFLQQQGVQALITRPDDRDLDLQPRVDLAEQANATVFVSIHANSIDLSRPDISGLETYYYQSGEGLAKMIHQSVLQMTGIPDRGVRTARFFVLHHTTMPSVLVEVGFVTGQADATKLSNSSYRTQMANAIARGILQYLQQTAQR